MAQARLAGVVAAIPTPLDPQGVPDAPAFVQLARELLGHGCDALNVLGTTGEATSFSVQERIALMSAAAEGLPTSRLMVGTGAASVSDAISLTRAAGQLGFAGALLLPPFYYKNVPAEGVLSYRQQVAAATDDTGIPLYLYNFPVQSGVPFSIEIVAEALRMLGTRLAGIKDSSGDLPYCRTAAQLSPQLAVFPSNEAALLEARNGLLAGCISATANVNSDLCTRAFRTGDVQASQQAVAIRNLFSSVNLVAGVKAFLATNRRQPQLAAVRAPLWQIPDAVAAELVRQASLIRSQGVAVAEKTP